MFTPQHNGLYFTHEHIKQAHTHRDHEPFKAALVFLRSHQPDDELAAMILGGLRYRFDGDSAAGERAASSLNNARFGDDLPYLDALMTALAAAQGFEMARDHPALSPEARARWLDGFAEYVLHLNQPVYDAAYVERLWLSALNVGAGVVLEREDLFEAGITVYRQAVCDDIRPEGYITRAVDDPALAGDGQSLYRQLLAVQSLVLTTEAASHAGVDLWEFHYRGVSVVTAATYLIYYYFYPEQWRWDEGLETEPTRALFRERGGFWEMLNRRRPPQGLKALLDNLRPVFDPCGGGLTMLTHGVAPRRRLFG